MAQNWPNTDQRSPSLVKIYRRRCSWGHKGNSMVQIYKIYVNIWDLIMRVFFTWRPYVKLSRDQPKQISTSGRKSGEIDHRAGCLKKLYFEIILLCRQDITCLVI